MDDASPSKNTTNASADVLSDEKLRDEVERAIDLLSKDVFSTLQDIKAQSILIYLIVKSVEPMVRKGLYVDDVIKKIWPTQYLIFKKYCEDSLRDDVSPTDFVLSILKTGDMSIPLFEKLLIFTSAIPLCEKHFKSQEWVLRELREELREWQRSGKFQQLLITIPSEQFEPATTSRGDLQIQVSASKPTIVAGKEFSVFVVINNPFEVPIVLYSVETQIPVELIDMVGRQFQRQSIMAEDASLRRDNWGLCNSLLRLTWDRWRVGLAISSQPDSRIAEAVSALETKKAERYANVAVNVNVERQESGAGIIGAQFDRFQAIDIAIDSASPKHLDNLLWRLQAYKEGLIPIVLQPGDSLVKQFIFRTKSWLFFTPLAHTLQIQVRYGVDDRDHLDTVPYQLTIQAAITATMSGAILGGAVGAVARILNELQTNPGASFKAQITSLSLAIILSAITIVSFARKSGVQQIVSVEDFWGGLFLGFLTGFLGQKFAMDIITPKH